MHNEKLTFPRVLINKGTGSIDDKGYLEHLVYYLVNLWSKRISRVIFDRF